MLKFQLKKPQIHQVGIRVKDFGGMVDFYEKLPGFYLSSQENNLGYFSSNKKQEPFIVLEGIRKAELEDHPKKLQKITLDTQNMEVLEKLKAFFENEKYPYEETVEEKTGELSFQDPEGNEIVFEYQESPQEQSFQYQLKDLHFHLFFEDEMTAFFTDTLGLKDSPGESYFPLNDEQGFFVTFQKDKPAGIKRVLGIDYITIQVENKENMQALKDFFEEENLAFYCDKKLSIMTVYDANQVEWWFVPKKEKKEPK